MDLLGLIGAIISILSGIATWYWGTKKKRLAKAIEEHQKKLKTIEGYVSSTGYKLILRDCFQIITYVFSIIFISLGASIFLYSINQNPYLKLFLSQFLGSVLIASGLILLDMCRTLSKTFKPEENLESMKKKLHQLEVEHSNI